MTERGRRGQGTVDGDKRAVSDLIGFILMFSIIILGVAVVSLAGITQLVSISETEEIRSAEQGMEDTAATLEDLHRLSDTNRTNNHHPIKNGLLFLDQTTLNITSDIPGAYDPSDNIQINALVHRFDRPNRDVTIRYEGGGVFRSNAAAPRYAPAFKCRSNNGGETVAIISVVNLTLNDTDSGFARAKSRGPNGELLDEYSVPSEAPIANFDDTLEFNAKRIEAVRHFNVSKSGTVSSYIGASQTGNPEKWDEYFETLDAETEWTRLAGGGTIECAADRTLIRVVTIELDFLDQGT